MLARLFARPGIWLALAILLLNDHVGKRLASQGVLPGALTGKLSDVAGLAFAPALAWALARVLGRSRGWAWSAFWLVPLVFTVLNLSSSACSAWTSFFAWFGLEQVIWSDPSDLLALPAVGLGYRWVRQSEQRSEPSGPR